MPATPPAADAAIASRPSFRSEQIRWARAVTQDGVALDVFHVTDRHGEPVSDPGLLGHLAMRIRERL